MFGRSQPNYILKFYNVAFTVLVNSLSQPVSSSRSPQHYHPMTVSSRSQPLPFRCTFAPCCWIQLPLFNCTSSISPILSAMTPILPQATFLVQSATKSVALSSLMCHTRKLPTSCLPYKTERESQLNQQPHCSCWTPSVNN